MREWERGERSERDAGRAQSRGGGVAAGSGSRPEVKAPGESHFVSLHNTFRLFRRHIPREKNNGLLGICNRSWEKNWYSWCQLIGVNSATLLCSFGYSVYVLSRREIKKELKREREKMQRNGGGGRCGRGSILSFNLLSRAKITVKLNYIDPLPQDLNRETHFFSADFVSFVLETMIGRVPFTDTYNLGLFRWKVCNLVTRFFFRRITDTKEFP